MAVVSISAHEGRWHKPRKPFICITAGELDDAEFAVVRQWIKTNIGSYDQVVPESGNPGELMADFFNADDARSFVEFLSGELGVYYANGQFTDINNALQDKIIEFNSYETHKPPKKYRER